MLTDEEKRELYEFVGRAVVEGENDGSFYTDMQRAERGTRARLVIDGSAQLPPEMADRLADVWEIVEPRL